MLINHLFKSSRILQLKLINPRFLSTSYVFQVNNLRNICPSSVWTSFLDKKGSNPMTSIQTRSTSHYKEVSCLIFSSLIDFA